MHNSNNETEVDDWRSLQKALFVAAADVGVDMQLGLGSHLAALRMTDPDHHQHVALQQSQCCHSSWWEHIEGVVVVVVVVVAARAVAWPQQHLLTRTLHEVGFERNSMDPMRRTPVDCPLLHAIYLFI